MFAYVSVYAAVVATGLLIAEAVRTFGRRQKPSSNKVPQGDISFESVEVTDSHRRWVDLWMKAEDIAMHFNELILNFRLKALGAVALGAGVIGSVLVSKDEVALELRLKVLAAALLFLACIWIAAWLIDERYYQQLLRGAVAEAKRFERASRGLLQMSLTIERYVNDSSRFGFRRPGRFAFYVLPLLALLGGAYLSYRFAPDSPSEAPRPPSVQSLEPTPSDLESSRPGKVEEENVVGSPSSTADSAGALGNGSDGGN